MTQLPIDLIHRSDTDRHGYDDGILRRLVAARQLVRLRRGSYLGAVDVASLDRERTHAAQIQAALVAQSTRSVVSHQSAAVLHGLPIWAVDLSTIHLNKQRRNAGRTSTLLHTHTAPLLDGDVEEVAGVEVTSVTRTVFDLAASLPFEQAVVLADAALHSGLTTPEMLADLAHRSRGRQGRQSAARAIAFADGRSESVGESRSRVGMRRARVPVPGLQFSVCRPDGTEAGRSDFDWDWLLGEFDGLVKYGRLRRPGEEPGDAVAREKLREDEFRDYGNDMIRWTWARLNRPDELYPWMTDRIARTRARRGRR